MPIIVMVKMNIIIPATKAKGIPMRIPQIRKITFLEEELTIIPLKTMITMNLEKTESL